MISRSAPASPSHVGISGLMTPECLSREASPGPESYPDSSVPSPAGQLATSQSAPGSPGHPYTSSQSTHKGRLMQTIVTNGVSGDTGREGECFLSLFNSFLIDLFFETIYNRSFIETEKYLVPGPNVVEDHSLSPAGQYSPAPVIVQTTYNYRYARCELN